jgi:hypothetical protein
MKKIYIIFVLVFVLLSSLIIGCIDEPIDPVWNPDDKGGPTPAITQITPEIAYASYTEMIIRGQNFNPVSENNFLYFNTTKVPVQVASSTELRLLTPNIPSDTVKIKVGAMGAQLFSNVFEYKILQTFFEMGDYGPIDAFFCLEQDLSGNLYVQIAVGTTGRIDLWEIGSDTAKVFGTTTGFGSSNAMKFGPRGNLVFARMSPIISRIAPGARTSSNLPNLPNTQNAYDVDFDKYGNMWVVGFNSNVNNRRVIRMKESTVSGRDTILIEKDFPFNAQIRACKVYNDYLYLAGGDGTDNLRVKIWRAAIDGNGDLGTFELYYDWASNYSYPINTMTIANDGTILCGTGTDSPDSDVIIAISPGKVASPLYPNDMKKSTYNVTWGSGPNSQYIFVSRRATTTGGSANSKIMKIYMGKEGAPYFGRN